MRMRHRFGGFAIRDLLGPCLLVGGLLTLGCVDEDGTGEERTPAPTAEAPQDAALDSIDVGAGRDPSTSNPVSPIEFRATGNEPGWHLEIRDDLESRALKRIRFVYDYGEGEAILHAPYPDGDLEGPRALYRGQNGDMTIVVEVERTQCSDTMADETFEATVTVEFMGRTFRGCGGKPK